MLWTKCGINAYVILYDVYYLNSLIECIVEESNKLIQYKSKYFWKLFYIYCRLNVEETKPFFNFEIYNFALWNKTNRMYNTHIFLTTNVLLDQGCIM